MFDFKEKEIRDKFKNRTLGSNMSDIEKVKEIMQTYFYQKNFGYESYGSTIFKKTDDNYRKNEKLCYNSQKEEKNMSFMMLYFDEENIYVGSDSRVTFKNGHYEDTFKKIYINDDKNMLIVSTGIATKQFNNQNINFPKEISKLLFSGINIYEALNTKVIDGKTYLDIIGNDTIHFFVAKKYEKPIIVDVMNSEIIIKIPKDSCRIYSNGDYDIFKANNDFIEKVKQGYFPEDAIKEVIEQIIKETNYSKTSTIGGNVQIYIL